MLAVDYLILNRDRHGANIEVLKNERKKTLRIAPLFDHGLSFMCASLTEKEIDDFDILADKPCQNFIGSRLAWENLNLIENKKGIFTGRLTKECKEILFENLENTISEKHREKIWEMLWARWCQYEDLCNF